MKKQLTEAQKEKAAERRSQTSAIAKRISAMTPEQKEAMLQSFGAVVTVEGRILSTFNTCMILAQAGDKFIPTMVGGFQQWKKAGRSVKKGEAGMAIWIHATKKDPENADVEKGYFTSGYVFDISQTEPILELETVN